MRKTLQACRTSSIRRNFASNSGLRTQTTPNQMKKMAFLTMWLIHHMSDQATFDSRTCLVSALACIDTLNPSLFRKTPSEPRNQKENASVRFEQCQTFQVSERCESFVRTNVLATTTTQSLRRTGARWDGSTPHVGRSIKHSLASTSE